MGLGVVVGAGGASVMVGAGKKSKLGRYSHPAPNKRTDIRMMVIAKYFMLNFFIVLS